MLSLSLLYILLSDGSGRICHITQNSAQFETYELFIFGIFILIFLDHRKLQIPNPWIWGIYCIQLLDTEFSFLIISLYFMNIYHQFIIHWWIKLIPFSHEIEVHPLQFFVHFCLNQENGNIQRCNHTNHNIQSQKWDMQKFGCCIEWIIV